MGYKIQLWKITILKQCQSNNTYVFLLVAYLNFNNADLSFTSDLLLYRMLNFLLDRVALTIAISPPQSNFYFCKIVNLERCAACLT